MSRQSEIINELAVEYARIAPLSLPCILQEHAIELTRIRAAGEELNSISGRDAMRDAIVGVHELTDGLFPTGSDFTQLWDGIGNWRA